MVASGSVLVIGTLYLGFDRLDLISLAVKYLSNYPVLYIWTCHIWLVVGLKVINKASVAWNEDVRLRHPWIHGSMLPLHWKNEKPRHETTETMASYEPFSKLILGEKIIFFILKYLSLYSSPARVTQLAYTLPYQGTTTIMQRGELSYA